MKCYNQERDISTIESDIEKALAHEMDLEAIIPALPLTISGIGLLTTGLIVLLIKKFRYDNQS